MKMIVLTSYLTARIAVGEYPLHGRRNVRAARGFVSSMHSATPSRTLPSRRGAGSARDVGAAHARVTGSAKNDVVSSQSAGIAADGVEVVEAGDDVVDATGAVCLADASIPLFQLCV
jgi:hypothetical protein